MDKWRTFGMACALVLMATPAAADLDPAGEKVGEPPHAHVEETDEHPGQRESTTTPRNEYGLGAVIAPFLEADDASTDESRGYRYVDLAVRKVVGTMTGLPIPPSMLSASDLISRLPIEPDSSSHSTR
ncbi:hypothetical protein [Thioalkalivibrio sp. ALgr3]|uniref:hypothetical protein n=1 Tax=Thioalkalivibrio sp. ALgr3 TaxID=1239292 RepID=UPI000379653A|nr:hypothetical protein [Thioalkalivibrio sp. ALgr3]